MLHIVRIVVLSLSITFAIIVLGLSAHLTSQSEEFFNVTFTFAALAIASAVITVVTLPVLLIVDLLRNGAFTSMVVVELPWLFIVWVLWLAAGADTANANSLLFDSSCSFVREVFLPTCHEVQAIEGFSFLNWIMLMAYSIVVFVMAIIGSTRGHKTWTTSVKNANFLGPAEGGVPAAGPEPGYTYNVSPQPPMQQQHQYPPPGTPSQYSSPPPTSVPSHGYPSPPPPGHSPYPSV